MARTTEPQPSAEVELSHAAQQARNQQAPIVSRPGATPDTSAEVLPASVESSRLDVRRELVPRNDPHGLERLSGARDIVSINFFERGLRAAKAVCRLKTLATRGGPADYATGFLVTPRLLLTNHHVLPDQESAGRTLAEFDLELDVNFVDRRGRIFILSPTEVFFTSAELDCTIVAISPVGHDGTPVTDYGYLPLIPQSGKGIPGEHVSIVQHPQGQTKQIVVRENKIISLDKDRYPGIPSAFIHYTADTERGSSGSPVFNDQWDLVAVHHRAIPNRNAKGEVLRRDGKVWSPADNEDNKGWIANQGTRVSAICSLLREASSVDKNAAKIVTMLAYEPFSAARVRTVPDQEVEPKRWTTIPGAPESAAFEAARFTDPEFASSMGFDSEFLDGLAVPLPEPNRAFVGTLATNRDTGGTIFEYTHFSLAMHVERRLAVWTAVNILGNELKSAPSPSWRRDKRLPANEQTLKEVYGKLPERGLQIDKGHLVRRLDPVWGAQNVADRAGADTFHYTNAAPQEHVFNSEVWGNLEDFVLARADERDHRACVLTGPVLRPDDDFYGAELRGGPWQIPWSFWKICIFVRPDGSPSVTGFVMEQANTIAPLFESSRYNPYSIEEARVFQRPIAVIEELTGLDFGPLRDLDRMGNIESSAVEAARRIRGADDIEF